MKKFLQKIFVFSLLLFVINLMLYRFAQQHYYSEYQLVPDKSFTSFLFADSHGTPLGNNPEHFGVFNFSAGSDSFFDIEQKIKFLLANNHTIDTVYITADPHTLSYHREKRNNLDRSNFYLVPDKKLSMYQFFKERYIAHYVVVFQPKVRQLLRSYFVSLASQLSGKTNPEDTEPAWADLSDTQQQKEARSRLRYQFPDEKTSLKLEESLGEIIRLGREHGFTVTGIQFPLARAYIDQLSGRTFGIDRIFRDNGNTILEYSDLYIDNDSLFDNQDHLTPEGGALFSRELFGK